MLTLRLRLSTLMLLLVVVCIFTWMVNQSLRPVLPPSQPIMQSVGTIAAEQPVITSNNNNNDELTTIQIYKTVSPGVVNITSTTLSFDFFFNAVPEQGSGSDT